MPFLCDPRPFFSQTSRGKPTQLVDWVLLFSNPFQPLFRALFFFYHFLGVPKVLILRGIVSCISFLKENYVKFHGEREKKR